MRANGHLERERLIHSSERFEKGVFREMIRDATIIDTDVLVIGGGGAAMRAAIAADALGTRTYMAVKGLFGHSGCTPVALAGYAAAFGNADPRDNWGVHFQDSCIGGGMVNNQKLVEILCKNAPERFKELESFGSLFDRDENQNYYQRQLGGHSYPRTCMSGDKTGGEVIRGLQCEILRREISVLADCVAVKLLKEEDRVVGCVAYDMKKGRFLVFRAKAIILASGGCGQVFKFCFAPYGKAGDANRMALEIGAELIDMELFQFHPTGYIAPESIAGQSISEGVRGDGGRLYNSKGERFMERYNPKQLELACRDFVSRCIYFEVKEGRGTKDGGVYLSLTHVPPKLIEERLPAMLDRALNYGIDVRKEPMIVYPSSHYQNGGIVVNTNWETRVKNLFAAGESAGGVHGGNRLGSNSLPDLQVSGKIAGENAAGAALSGSFDKINIVNFGEELSRVEGELSDVVSGDNGINPLTVRNEIKNLSWDYVGIARNEEKLKHALATIEDIKRNRMPQLSDIGRSFNVDFIESMDVRSMVVCLEAMARAALVRKESRCGHFREDLPLPDKKWVANIIVSQDKDGRLVLNKRPIVKTILDPEEVEMPIFPTSGKIDG